VANPQYNKMMKQVQEMQRKMAQAQEELAVETVEASAGGGVVTVVVTGSLEIKEVRIDPDAVDPEDVEMLQDLVVDRALRAAGRSESASEFRQLLARAEGRNRNNVIVGDLVWRVTYDVESPGQINDPETTRQALRPVGLR